MKNSTRNVPGIDSEYRIGYDLTKELLRTEKDLTAIVGLNDMIAFGIMDALQDMKYKVPGDVSVMGCDNTLFSKVKKVSLTTIEHFVVHKGMDACDIIMKKISSRDTKYTEFEPVSIYHVEYQPNRSWFGEQPRMPKGKRKNKIDLYTGDYLINNIIKR